LAIAPLEQASSCPKTMGLPTELTEFHGKERCGSAFSVYFDAYGIYLGLLWFRVFCVF
jgi:hypothetical protein